MSEDRGIHHLDTGHPVVFAPADQSAGSGEDLRDQIEAIITRGQPTAYATDELTCAVLAVLGYGTHRCVRCGQQQAKPDDTCQPCDGEIYREEIQHQRDRLAEQAAENERLTAQLVAQAEAMADLDTKATQAYEDRDAALHRAEQAEAERDKTLRDLGTANGDAEDAERERDDIANTLLAQDFATAEATARAEQAEAERDRLRAAEKRVRELHSPDKYGDCKGCGLTRYEEAIPWAECDTIAALGQGDDTSRPQQAADDTRADGADRSEAE